ncbi:GTP pyrophosphokinase [Halalkalibacter oceani]|uniref:GTP pyrophosphokinase n=1 Tax=Halalkalibacter oceani TaxID=1653776 RepID=UPI003D9C9CCA
MNPATTIDLKRLKAYRTEATRFMMTYKFALDEMNTKIKILQEEFQLIHDYNPIEHISSRLKSPESILKKLHRKHYPITLESIKENIKDVAGIRITCSFLTDIYQLSEMIQKQGDIKVLEVKDYLRDPKPNGYRSLHLIIEVPVYMSDRQSSVCVEVQIRTIAMDFWASLEHKIYYKYNKEIPERLLLELKNAADLAAVLDKKMEDLHKEVGELKDQDDADEIEQMINKNEKIHLPSNFLTSLFND